MRLLEMICKTLREDLQGFTRICKMLGEDLWGFARIHETLEEDLQGFVRIHETLGEDLQGFMRLWERICKDLQGFVRLLERIREDSQGILSFFPNGKLCVRSQLLNYIRFYVQPMVFFSQVIAKQPGFASFNIWVIRLIRSIFGS